MRRQVSRREVDDPLDCREAKRVAWSECVQGGHDCEPGGRESRGSAKLVTVMFALLATMALPAGSALAAAAGLAREGALCLFIAAA